MDKMKDNNHKIIFIPVTSEIHSVIIESLAKEIWTEHYVTIIGKEQVDYMLSRFQSSEAVLEQIENGALYFLMRESDVFIGYIAVHPKQQELFLSKIYLRSSKRGIGYGRKAVQFVENLAKERSLTKIALTVNKHNIDTISAYEKMGFKITGALIQDIGGDFFMDDFAMEKDIS